nr:MAG TPA: hypothetical protein [Caudoviricetes sp.]
MQFSYELLYVTIEVETISSSIFYGCSPFRIHLNPTS